MGYILGHLCELILFVYYAKISFYPKHSAVVRGATVLIGYGCLFVVGLKQNVILSNVAFYLVNAFLLMFGYRVSTTKAALCSLMLDLISVVGEYIVIFILSIDFFGGRNISSTNSMIITVLGKFIYFIGVIILTKMTGKESEKNGAVLILIAMPALSIAILSVLVNATMSNAMFCFVCIAFVCMNFIMVFINAGINEKNNKLRKLQHEYDLNKAALLQYNGLAESYENTKIMRHDFRKQLEILKNMIDTDNNAAKEHINQLQKAQNELNVAEYTDNGIVNIIINRKRKECDEKGIEMQIHSTKPTLRFVEAVDSVAVFENLLDNAIEACQRSNEKDIFLDMYTVNSAYTAIKLENSADCEPIAVGGFLRTQKNNSDIHGLGVRSINNALKKYGSKMDWSYDKNNKIFRTIILFSVPY